jgi:hypothetical protein
VDIESRSDLRHRPRHAASTKAEDAIERYLLAFAAGTMPESTCSQRVQVLAEKDAGLRERRADLNAELDMTQTGPTPADLDALRPRIRNTIATGNTAAQKDLLATLVHDIQASARDDIRPVFKIPSAGDQPPAQAKVRKPTVSVPLIVQLSNRQFRTDMDRLVNSLETTTPVQERAAALCRCGCRREVEIGRKFVRQVHYNAWLSRERFVGRNLRQ